MEEGPPLVSRPPLESPSELFDLLIASWPKQGTTCEQHLKTMLRDHSKLIWVVQGTENQIELHYERSKLISALRQNGPVNFELTSFERGLKHLGM
jgi:hypothetical protein